MAVTAIAAAAAIGTQAYAAEKQAKAQRKGLRLQERAQTEAENRALRQEREAQVAENRVNRRAPDLSVLLAQQLPKPGPTGIDANRLLLGKPGLLGAS